MAKLKMERTHYDLIADGVAEHEQTLAVNKPFWVFFGSSLGISTWLMGVLIAGMGLNFTDAMFVLFLGSLAGAALPAAMAILGPLTRLSQIESGRFSLGRTGKKLPAILNWVGAIGWDVINNILSATAFVALLAMYNFALPFWLALGILVAVQLVIGVYGHHLVQDFSKYCGYVLTAFFIIIGMIAIHKTGAVPVAEHAAQGKDIFLAFILLVAFNISTAPYAADYTRYVPRKTPSGQVFFVCLSALFLALFILGFFGYMTASAVTEQTPEGVMKALQGLSGSFASLVLFVVALSAIPPNAVNDNSAAYCLMSAGFKLSRPTLAIFGAVLSYAVCLLASGSFIDFFENFLFLFAHWIAPWAAILLVHWFVVGKKEQKTPSGITVGCVIFVAVTIASISLFSSNSLYTGLLSNQIGGADIGPYIGFTTAGLVYYATLKLRSGK